MAVIRTTAPPISSISVLLQLTQESYPCRYLGGQAGQVRSGQGGLGDLGDLGGQGLGLGLGGLGLGG